MLLGISLILTGRKRSCGRECFHRCLSGSLSIRGKGVLNITCIMGTSHGRVPREKLTSSGCHRSGRYTQWHAVLLCFCFALRSVWIVPSRCSRGALILAGSVDWWLHFKLFQLINISDIASRIRASRNVNYFYGWHWCTSAPDLLYNYEFIFRYFRPLSFVVREAVPARLNEWFLHHRKKLTTALECDSSLYWE